MTFEAVFLEEYVCGRRRKVVFLLTIDRCGFQEADDQKEGMYRSLHCVAIRGKRMRLRGKHRSSLSKLSSIERPKSPRKREDQQSRFPLVRPPILERGFSHMSAKVLSERALIAETIFQGDLSNGLLGRTEIFASCLNPRLDEEGFWIRPENLTKPSVELTYGHTGSAREIRHVDRFLEMLPNVVHGPIKFEMGRERGFVARVALHRSHDPDNRSVR